MTNLPANKPHQIIVRLKKPKFYYILLTCLHSTVHFKFELQPKMFASAIFSLIILMATSSAGLKVSDRANK
jgi:hypothetical protein